MLPHFFPLKLTQVISSFTKISTRCMKNMQCLTY